MRGTLDTIGGLMELAGMWIRSRMRLSGPYWRWRHETAFGTDPKLMPSRWLRIKQTIAYGRWVYRIKRGR